MCRGPRADKLVSMSDRDTRLAELGYPLDRVPDAAARYQPLVIDGAVGYLSGAIPFDGSQGLVCVGRVPSEASVEAARHAAALCAANLLRVLVKELGSLDRVERVLRVGGYVNSDPEFNEQHLVVNGASDLLVRVMGAAGAHARSAVGVSGLPLGASVEIDMMVRLST